MSKKKMSYEEKIREAKYKRIYQTLREIASIEAKPKPKDKDGKEILDFEAACNEIKTKARLAIEFVEDLEKDDEKK